MSKVTQNAQQYWDERSSLFGNYYQKPTMFDKVFRKGVYLRVAVAIKACKELGNATVLDIGSGPGINSISFLRNANASYLTGIDFAPNMNAYAEEQIADAGLSDRATFILGDFMDQDFKEDEFDFSAALGVLDYIEDAPNFIKKMAKVSRKSFVVSWPENGLRMALRRYRYKCPVYHYDQEGIEKLHTDAGISNVEIVRGDAGWVTIARK